VHRTVELRKNFWVWEGVFLGKEIKNILSII